MTSVQYKHKMLLESVLINYAFKACGLVISRNYHVISSMQYCLQSCAINIRHLARKDSVLVKLFIFIMRKDRIIGLS